MGSFQHEGAQPIEANAHEKNMRQKRRQQNEKGIYETRSEEDQLPVHQSSRRVGPTILRSGVDESYRLDPMGRDLREML